MVLKGGKLHISTSEQSTDRLKTRVAYISVSRNTPLKSHIF